jgi:hypothetical protein
MTVTGFLVDIGGLGALKRKKTQPQGNLDPFLSIFETF